MEVIEALKNRRSVRNYKDRSISKELLQVLVDAARYAPTARGVEPWEFVIITDAETLKKLGGLIENARFLSSAKACVAIFSQDTKYYLEDCSAATENLLIAAYALGIGSCWVAGDKKPYCQEVANMLGVPGSFKLVSLVSLGYPDTKFIPPSTARKRDLNQLTHWEKF